MKLIFVDTFFWIALLDLRDEWHLRAVSLTAELPSVALFTTEPVLIEFANYFAERGPFFRQAAVSRVREILDSPVMTVVPSSREQFLAGLSLYAQRADKGYSLTDCISMQSCANAGFLKFSPTTTISPRKDFCRFCGIKSG